jgi:hypothetical protein
VPGFASIGILGNVMITGTLTASSAIVSAGVIGDAAHGTLLNTGNIQGIIAAEGNINLGKIGSSQGAFILPSATTNDPMSAFFIDAIFTENGVPLSFDLPMPPSPLGGLNLMLEDLGALQVVNGHLTFPNP